MKNKKVRDLFLALILALLCPLVGHSQGIGRYAGGAIGSQTISGTTLQNCYAFQHDRYEGQFTEAKRRPLFAIVWQGRATGEVTSNGENLLTSIHGHSVNLSRSKKAVYALQPDYSLRPLPLSEREIDHLFAIAHSKDNPPPMFYKDAVWQSKVEPFLYVVEPPKKSGRR